MTAKRLEQKKSSTHAIALDWDKTFLRSHSHNIVISCFTFLHRLNPSDSSSVWKENLQYFVNHLSAEDLHPKDKDNLLARLTHPKMIETLRCVIANYKSVGSLDSSLHQIAEIILPVLSPSDTASNWCKALTEAAEKNIGIAFVTACHPAIKQLIPVYLNYIIKLPPSIIKDIWIPEYDQLQQIKNAGTYKNPVLRACITHFNLDESSSLIFVDDDNDNVVAALETTDPLLASRIEVARAMPEKALQDLLANLHSLPIYKARDAKESRSQTAAASRLSPVAELSSPLALSRALSELSLASPATSSPTSQNPSAFFSSSSSSSTSSIETPTKGVEASSPSVL